MTIFETIYNKASYNRFIENKEHLIKRLVLPDVPKENHEEAINNILNFFKKHSNLENKVDWNNYKTIPYSDFESLIKNTENSKSSKKKQRSIEIKKDINNLFNDIPEKNIKFKIHKNLENNKWLFVSPLTYEAAKFMDSYECGGGGAKWCIGYEDDDYYWNYHSKEKNKDFIMVFNKDYNNLSKEFLNEKLKYMIELDEHNNINIWDQKDNNRTDISPETFGISVDQVISAFNSKRIKHYEWWINDYTVKVPEGISKLEKDCFSNCYTLKKVILPSSLTDIGENAFTNCTRLAEINLPENLEYIGDSAFSGCRSLSGDLVIPPKVVSIGKFAFSITRFNSIKLSGDVQIVHEGAFMGSLESTILDLRKAFRLSSNIIDASISDVLLAKKNKFMKPDTIDKYFYGNIHYYGTEEEWKQTLGNSDRNEFHITFL